MPSHSKQFYQKVAYFLSWVYSTTLLFFLLNPISYAQGSPNTGSPSSGVPNAQEVLQNIADQVPALTGLVYAIVYILGISFIFGGLLKLKHYGEQRSMMSSHGGLGGALMLLLVGTLLLFLPSTIQVSTTTFWATPCSYCYPTDSESPFTSFFKVVYSVVNFVGLIAFVRGLVMLSHVGEHSQHGGLGKAMTHIIGGILCMNIGAFVQTIFATLGIKF